MASFNWGREALMLGNLMILASAVLASSPAGQKKEEIEVE
jgi:hypothetical protein